MTTETFDDFELYIARNANHFEISFQRMRPSFLSSEASFLEIEYPTTPLKVAYSANLCATLASQWYQRQHFDGAWLWFADEPFSGWEQAAGRVAIDRIRAGFGDLRPFNYRHVYNFRSDEIELLTAFVIFGFVLLWDVYILTGRGDRIIHVSHDEIFGVYVKNDETKKYIQGEFPELIIAERSQ